MFSGSVYVTQTTWLKLGKISNSKKKKRHLSRKYSLVLARCTDMILVLTALQLNKL